MVDLLFLKRHSVGRELPLLRLTPLRDSEVKRFEVDPLLTHVYSVLELEGENESPHLESSGNRQCQLINSK